MSDNFVNENMPTYAALVQRIAELEAENNEQLNRLIDAGLRIAKLEAERKVIKEVSDG